MPSPPLPPPASFFIIIRVRERRRTATVWSVLCMFFAFFALLKSIMQFDVKYATEILFTFFIVCYIDWFNYFLCVLPFTMCVYVFVCVCSLYTAVPIAASYTPQKNNAHTQKWMTTTCVRALHMKHVSCLLSTYLLLCFVHIFMRRAFDNDSWSQFRKNFMWRKCH